MPNVIDELGAKVVGSRYRGEDDQDYATRVLDKLYRTYLTVNASGWTGDQETNEYNLTTENGCAYIARDPGRKTWIYTVIVGQQPWIDGQARYLEKAMQICSLVLS